MIKYKIVKKINEELEKVNLFVWKSNGIPNY